MRLTPKETEKLLLSYAGEVAARRRRRGLLLNYVEAIAYISSALMEMARDGKAVTALMEEGARLLEALSSATTKTAGKGGVVPEPPPAPASPRGARWFRVRVTDLATGRVRVNIRLPITVVTTGFKLGARFSTEVDGLDMKTLMDSIRSGETGQIVDVYDDKESEHVEVFLE